MVQGHPSSMSSYLAISSSTDLVGKGPASLENHKSIRINLLQYKEATVRVAKRYCMIKLFLQLFSSLTSLDFLNAVFRNAIILLNS